MISIIITSYKEPKNIGKAITSITQDLPKDYEIIQISPDVETLEAGKKVAQELNLKGYRQIKDPCKGKPAALNLAFKEAQGEIIILTDGDVFFGEKSITAILEPFKNKKVGGVTGRPISKDSKETMMGYIGNLLSDAAHHKRENSSKENSFFPMSGYIMAIRNLSIELPEDVLSDDAYISYFIAKNNFEIAYAPKAKAYVKYPKNLKDYYKQKVRSLGGYIQLEKYSIIDKTKKTRTFKDELSYFWFPFSYASNIKEYFWSLMLFPIRFITWIKIFIERRILKKDFGKTWTRIESTK
jgi:poly-beta-1,6-N-acetyl-D-glucosamine synthase